MSAVNTLKAKVMNAYSESVRSGKLREAWLLLALLRYGKISLGLGEAAHNVEYMLGEIGCRIRYTGNYNIARVYLAPEA